MTRDPWSPQELRGEILGAPIRVGYGFLDLNDGGAQRLTLTACRHLRRDRFRPTLLLARGGGSLVEEARSEGIEVEELGRMRRSFDFRAVSRLAGQLEESAIEILHLPLYSRSFPYFRLAARLAGVPLVVAHDWSQPSESPWLRRQADALMASGLRYVAASIAQKEILMARGVDESCIAVVHAGIDRGSFGIESREQARRRLQLDEAAKVALVVARLDPVKGHADMLSSLPTVLEGEPDLIVLCAGQGPLLGSLERLADEMGVRDSVRFLGQRDDIPRLLAASDLLVLPSRHEGLPSAILEAFAARRAVVATEVGGVPEALTDGVEGRLVPALDPDALGSAILEVLGDPIRRHAMGEEGGRTVAQRFDAVTCTRSLEEVYEGWLARAPLRHGATT